MTSSAATITATPDTSAATITATPDTSAVTITAKSRSRKRFKGNNWSEKKYWRRPTHVIKNVKVRFICPSLIPDVKKFKVRATYEYSAGLRTTMHYPQQCTYVHKPYTCKPKTVAVRAKYIGFNDMQTTLHYPQRLVLKHYI